MIQWVRMNLKELKKIEIKDDGKNDTRFYDLAKKVVNVPKESLKTSPKTKQKRTKKA